MWISSVNSQISSQSVTEFLSESAGYVASSTYDIYDSVKDELLGYCPYNTDFGDLLRTEWGKTVNNILCLNFSPIYFSDAPNSFYLILSIIHLFIHADSQSTLKVNLGASVW